MSKQEFPSDAAVNMLHPRDTPRAIIVHTETCAFVRGDACTEDELRALKFNEDRIKNADLLKRKDFGNKAESDDFVHRAMALGFGFRTPEDEKRIVKNTTFVMHRRPA